jgi:hypothetical protein
MLPRKSAVKAETVKQKVEKKKPTLEEFVTNRDWSGALGLLQV